MAKETETETSARVTSFTVRVSQSFKDEFERLFEEGAYDTKGMLMDALLERYQNPVKINKENAGRIADLEKQLETAKSQIRENLDKFESFYEDHENLKKEYNAAMATIEQLKHDNETQHRTIDEYETLKTSIDGCISVPVSDLDMKCLEFMAAREARVRKRNDITPATFFMYAVREMLIKGNKFAIDSVPDSVIEKFKKETGNGK